MANMPTLFLCEFCESECIFILGKQAHYLLGHPPSPKVMAFRSQGDASRLLDRGGRNNGTEESKNGIEVPGSTLQLRVKKCHEGKCPH